MFALVVPANTGSMPHCLFATAFDHDCEVPEYKALAPEQARPPLGHHRAEKLGATAEIRLRNRRPDFHVVGGSHLRLWPVSETRFEIPDAMAQFAPGFRAFTLRQGTTSSCGLNCHTARSLAFPLHFSSPLMLKGVSMTKTLLALSLALSLPAFAHDDPACVPTHGKSGGTVYYVPTETHARQRDQVSSRAAAAERRREWFRKHMVNEPILGNMANAPGTSALSYLHGTDNPQGHIFLDTDEGPSSIRSRATADDESGDSF